MITIDNFIQIPGYSFAQTFSKKHKTLAENVKLTDTQPNTFSKGDSIISVQQVQYLSETGDAPPDSDSSGGTPPFAFVPRRLLPETSTAPKKPGSSGGGTLLGVVSNCKKEGNLNIRLLVPGDPESFPGLTAEPYPTFWFYVPYKSDNGNTLRAKFKLQDDKDTIFDDIYPLAKTPGIINITLPSNSKPLKIGKKDYSWTFSILCDERDPSANIWLSGKVERVKHSHKLTPSSTTTPEEKVRLYAKDGLWNDALTIIIKKICPKKQFNLQLNQLLNSVELDKPYKEEILKSCTHDIPKH